MKIPDKFINRLKITHGNEITDDWLSKLPSYVSKYEKLWDIKVTGIVENVSYNFVAHAISNSNHKKVIFKLMVLERQFLSEIQALKYFSGPGCVKVLNYNVEDRVMLLEEIVPGINLETYFNSHKCSDEEASIICANLVKKLHTSRSNNDWLIKPRELTESIDVFKQIKAEVQGDNSPFDLSIILRAEKEYLYLLDSTQKNVLLHADLHHSNILKSSQDDWGAIDPFGIMGDIIFEIVPFILHPFPGLSKIGDAKKVMQNRIDIFADRLAFDKYRIWAWCFSQSILTAHWWEKDKIDYWQELYEVSKCLLKIESNNC